MKKIILSLMLGLLCIGTIAQNRYGEITVGSGLGFTTVDGQRLLEFGQTYSYNYFLFGWNLAPSKASEQVYGTGTEKTPSSYEIFGGLTLSRKGEKIYPIKPYMFCGVQVIDYYYKDLYYGQRIKSEEKEKNFLYGAGIHFQYPKSGGGAWWLCSPFKHRIYVRFHFHYKMRDKRPVVKFGTIVVYSIV